MNGPSPDTLHPMEGFDQVSFLKPMAEGRSNLEIGDYAYYDDREKTRDFFDRNVLNHFDFMGDKLVIGPFAALAYGVQIAMNGGTHAMSGFSTYPFNIFGNGWEVGFDPATWTQEFKGDTVIGADVWIGTEAMILPGVTIGPGAIIAARSVVTKDVPPYAVVAGNPARIVRERFDADTVAKLLDIAWWEWDAAKITKNLNAIRGNDLNALEAVT